MFGLIGFLFRKLLLLILLAASVLGPYAYFNDDWRGSLNSMAGWFRANSNEPGGEGGFASELLSGIEGFQETDQAPAVDARSPAPRVPQRKATLVGPEVRQLQDVLRFSATPSWIMANWSRVSSVRDDNLHGLRVPLLTGTRLDDIAGSLTYYFDKRSMLQRIVFRGTTGDDRKLAALVGRNFGLKPQNCAGVGLYLARWNGATTSVLRVENSPIIRSSSPHSRLSVYMEINRPRSYLQVSDEMQQWLSQQESLDRTWRF